MGCRFPLFATQMGGGVGCMNGFWVFKPFLFFFLHIRGEIFYVL